MHPIRATISAGTLAALAIALVGCHLLFPFDLDAPVLDLDTPIDQGPAGREPAIDLRDGPLPDADVVPWPFGVPAQVAALNTWSSNDEDPTLTGDLLEIYFTSNRTGTKGIWFSTRADPDAAWDPPQPLSVLNTSTTDEFAPRVSSDGMLLYFGRYSETMQHEILVSTRADRSAPWSPGTLVQELNSPLNDVPGHPDRGLTLLPVASDRQGGKGGYDIYAAEQLGGGKWGTPVPLAGINAGLSDKDPWISGDMKVLYFASNRLDGVDFEIFLAIRSDPMAAFSPPTPVTELNTAGTVDEDPWLSPDLMQIFFASRRDGGLLNIYRATRQAP
jgi:hypothetical protein